MPLLPPSMLLLLLILWWWMETINGLVRDRKSTTDTVFHCKLGCWHRELALFRSLSLGPNTFLKRCTLRPQRYVSQMIFACISITKNKNATEKKRCIFFCTKEMERDRLHRLKYHTRRYGILNEMLLHWVDCRKSSSWIVMNNVCTVLREMIARNGRNWRKIQTNRNKKLHSFPFAPVMNMVPFVPIFLFYWKKSIKKYLNQMHELSLNAVVATDHSTVDISIIAFFGMKSV